MVVTELDKGKDVDENQASKHRLALLLLSSILVYGKSGDTNNMNASRWRISVDGGL